MTTFARTIKQPDLVNEIVEADHRADEFLDGLNDMHNKEANCRDPPTNLGKFFNDYTRRNPTAYSDYKSIGIEQIAKTEVHRYEKKLKLQLEAKRKGIRPKNMREFQQKRMQEEIWREIIPESLIDELNKKDGQMMSELKSKRHDLNTSIGTSTSNSYQDSVRHGLKQPTVIPFSRETKVTKNRQTTMNVSIQDN